MAVWLVRSSVGSFPSAVLTQSLGDIHAMAQKATAAMNAQSVVREIKGAVEFLEARQGSAAQAVRANLAKQMALQIRSLGSVSTTDAVALANALQGNPFGDDTSVVTEALDNALTGSLAMPDVGQAHAKTHHLYHFYNYATQADWDVFRRRDLTMVAKMERAVFRLNSYGCHHPHEQTIKRVLGILLLTHFAEYPSYNDVYAMVQDMKGVIDSNRKPSGLPVIERYPELPCDLPDSIKSAALDATDPPVSVQLVGLQSIVDKHIPLRKSSRLLKKTSCGGSDNVTWSQMRELLKGEVSPTIRFFDTQHGPQGHTGLRAMGSSEQLALDSASAVSERISFDGRAQGSIKPLALPSVPHTGSSGSQGPDVTLSVRGRDAGDGALSACDIPADLMAKAVQPAPSHSPSPSPTRTLAEPPAETPEPIASAAPTCSGDSPSLGDLNDFEKAAIVALKKRDDDKVAEKKKQKRIVGKSCVAEHSADDEAKSGMKRPASAMKYTKGGVEATVVTKTTPCPGLGAPPPQDYKGGRIYVNSAKRGFRVLRDSKDRFSERFISWKGDAPTSPTWAAALQAVDDYCAKDK